MVLLRRMVRKSRSTKKGSQLEHVTAHEHHLVICKSDVRLYRLGFWLFFVLIIMSVTFSVWAISSIYENYKVVTRILDESFDRTNLVMDITSSKITSCQEGLQECQMIVAANRITVVPAELG